MRKFLTALLFLGLAATAIPETSQANAQTDCAAKFLAGETPRLTNQNLAARSQQICFSAFAVLHSGLTRTSLWSAERLTPESVALAQTVRRTNAFHAESAVTPDAAAKLSDYARSGYDRGHLAPSGDMPTEKAQEESFSLANMIPQSPNLNRGLWEEIESDIREMAVREGPIYVVTGPIYRGATLKALKGRVLVPTSVFKAVYDPRSGVAGAYVAANVDNATYDIISMAQLRSLTGIDVFPAMSEAAKTRIADLPTPAGRVGATVSASASGIGPAF